MVKKRSVEEKEKEQEGVVINTVGLYGDWFLIEFHILNYHKI